MKSILYLACFLFLIIGCDNNDGDDDITEGVGQYNMIMMDGSDVPGVFTDNAGNELVLAGGELVIRDDGRYFLEISVVVDLVDETVSVSGDYSLSGQSLTLENGITGTYDGADKIELSYPIVGLSHLFTFDKSSVFERPQ